MENIPLNNGKYYINNINYNKFLYAGSKNVILSDTPYEWDVFPMESNDFAFKEGKYLTDIVTRFFTYGTPDYDSGYSINKKALWYLKDDCKLE